MLPTRIQHQQPPDAGCAADGSIIDIGSATEAGGRMRGGGASKRMALSHQVARTMASYKTIQTAEFFARQLELPLAEEFMLLIQTLPAKARRKAVERTM